MKKIVHAMLDCFYKEGMGYQENILTAKHKQMGYDVHIITYDQNANPYCKTNVPTTYTNADGITVHILAASKNPLRRIPIVVGWVYATKGLKTLLELIEPDIIFVHGICKYDNMHLVNYKYKHPNVKLFADNHSDYYNTPIKTIRQKIYRYGVGRYIGKHIGAVAEKVWGVTPWRVVYQQNVYHVPSEKSDLLVMGGDEDKIRYDERPQIRHDIRKVLNIPEYAFMIVTGGKIDKNKNIHLLTEAVEDLSKNDKDIHLIIFGKIEQDMQQFFSKYQENSNVGNIHYIGWIKAEKVYDYFLASDLAFFPGTHSVLWEQACACGLPAVFKDWDGGFRHVDVGGNCILLKEISEQSIKECISNIINDESAYSKMQEIASIKAMETFSYMTIAKKSIGMI